MEERKGRVIENTMVAFRRVHYCFVLLLAIFAWNGRAQVVYKKEGDECPVCPAWCEMKWDDDSPSYTKLYAGQMFDSSLWIPEREFQMHLDESDAEESDKKKAAEEVEERYVDKRGVSFVKVNGGEWIFGTNPFSQPPWNCPVDCSTRCGDQDPHNTEEEAERRGEVGHDLIAYQCCYKDLGVEKALEELGRMCTLLLDNLDEKLDEMKENLKRAVEPLLAVPRIMHNAIKSLLEWIVEQYKDTEIYKTVTAYLAKLAGKISFNVNTLLEKGREYLKSKDLLSWTIVSTGGAVSALVNKITDFFQAIEEMYRKIAKRVNAFLESLPFVENKKKYALKGGEAPTVDVIDAPMKGYWSGNVSPYCEGISVGVKFTDGKLVGCVQEHAHEVCLDAEKEGGRCPSKSAYIERELQSGVSVPLEPLGFLRLRARATPKSGLMFALLLRVPENPLTGSKIDVPFFEIPIGSASGDEDRFRSETSEVRHSEQGLLRRNGD